MHEQFLGTGSPMWTGLPSPGFGWFQAPVALANRLAGVSIPSAFASSVQPDMLGYGAIGVTGLVPALAGPEVPYGPSARMLLGAVAARRGQPMGPTNDHENEEFLYDALDFIGASDVEVRVEGGRATLTGTVAHKRLKRDAGELAWAMPSVSDVQNTVTIAGRRRQRIGVRDAESQSAAPSRKTA
jgi:hypothetical protein